MWTNFEKFRGTVQNNGHQKGHNKQATHWAPTISDAIVQDIVFMATWIIGFVNLWFNFNDDIWRKIVTWRKNLIFHYFAVKETLSALYDIRHWKKLESFMDCVQSSIQGAVDVVCVK